MALSKDTIEALKKEVKSLEFEIKRLTDDMDVLALKRSAAIVQRATMLKLIAPTPTDQEISKSEMPKAPKYIGDETFRNAVRIVVRHAGRPMRPKQVVAAMLAGGFKDNGDAITPLTIRVGNELHKLYTSKEFTRTDDGYAINPNAEGGQP